MIFFSQKFLDLPLWYYLGKRGKENKLFFNPYNTAFCHIWQKELWLALERWKTLSWGMRVPWLYQKCHELSFEPSFIPQIIIKRVKRDHLLIQIPQNCYRLYWLVCSYPLKSRVCHIWQKSKWSLFTIFMMIWGMNDGSNESSWHFW